MKSLLLTILYLFAITLSNAQKFTPEAIPIGISGAQDIAIDDYNNDGLPDMAITTGVNTVRIKLNEGNRVFSEGIDYLAENGLNIKSGDFNGDDNVDLAITRPDNNRVSVLLGNGDGTFQNTKNFVVGYRPRGIAIADFNNDNFMDIAVANRSEDSVSVLLSIGDGTFMDPIKFKTLYDPFELEAGDMNQDGAMDIVVGHRGYLSGQIFHGDGNGNFFPATYFDGSHWDIALGDMNNDGLLDIVTARAVGTGIDVIINEVNGV